MPTRIRPLSVSAALLIPLAIACASVEPPVDTLNAAEKSLHAATEVGAEPYARLEMHLAREHLTAARVAMAEERYEQARELAEKALVEAQLAEAKTEARQAEQNVKEIREHIETLRREIDRAQGSAR